MDLRCLRLSAVLLASRGTYVTLMPKPVRWKHAKMDDLRWVDESIDPEDGCDA